MAGRKTESQGKVRALPQTHVPPSRLYQQLRELAEQACRNAIGEGKAEGANVANLYVSEVFWGVDDTGSPRWIVTVEEASPTAIGLQNFILNQIQEAGIFIDIVEVRLEW